jgi:restriction endonuclease S subunit
MKTFLNKEFFLANDIIESANYNSIYGLNTKGLGYPIIRMNEFEELFTGKPSQHSENFSKKDFDTHCLKKDDILICRTNGNPNLIGKSALVAKDYPYVYESHMFKVRANRNLINSATLAIYLNTKYGRLEIDRLSMQGNQANFSLSKFKEVRIPKLSQYFCNIIEKNIYESFKKSEESKKLYKQSEQLLLKELDLLNFEPSCEKIAIKTFKQSFGDSGRLDSEYYQPKYDEIIKKFEKFETIRLNKLVTYSISSGATPKAGGDDYTDIDNGIPFIRAVNIINSKVEFDNVLFIKDYIHNKKLKKTQLKENDVLFSIAGTVGRCGISYYKKEANINQAIAILRFNDDIIKRLYLILFFNSEMGKLYITKYSRQGVQTNLNLDEVGNLQIPIIDYLIQTKIEEKIKESFSLKQNSKELLEVAKKAVEIAIENRESDAMVYLEAKI